MPNFFYFDQSNQKLGPVTEEQLRELAAQGTITPQTPMETDTGHKGVAGQIPGLTFGTAPPNPFAQSVPASPSAIHCTNCGKPVAENVVVCMSCGAKPVGHKKFCRSCGAATTPEQVVCLKCGVSLTDPSLGDKGKELAQRTAAEINERAKEAGEKGKELAAAATVKGKELAQRGKEEFSKGAKAIMSGLSAAKDAAQAQVKQDALNSQLVAVYRSLGDAAEKAGWGDDLCDSIRKQRDEVATITAQYNKAVADVEATKNTPGAEAAAAHQAMAGTKKQGVRATGGLNDLREKLGRALFGDASAPANIVTDQQRAEIARLQEEIAECERITAGNTVAAATAKGKELAQLGAAGLSAAKDTAQAWIKRYNIKKICLQIMLAIAGMFVLLVIIGLIFDDESDDSSTPSNVRQSSGQQLDVGKYTSGRATQREMEALRTLADGGDAEALYILGKCYIEGAGVSQDRVLGLRLIRAAAEQGYAEAQYQFALALSAGGEEYADEIVKQLQNAARQGHEGARRYLRDFGLSW